MAHRPVIYIDQPNVPRDYKDAAGRPLAVGDKVAVALSYGSSARLQFAVVAKFVDSNEGKLHHSERVPGGGLHGWQQFYSYRDSWTVRLHYLDFDKRARLFLPKKAWNGKEHVRPDDLSQAKTNTIRKIENLVKVDIPTPF